ncbi:hypothetical protein LCGC14_2610130, partial [marine sediment metagenome]
MRKMINEIPIEKCLLMTLFNYNTEKLE